MKGLKESSHKQYDLSLAVVTFALSILLLIAFPSTSKAAKNKLSLLADTEKVDCAIIVANGNKLCTNAAVNLQNYFKKVCGNAPKIMQDLCVNDLPKSMTCIIIGLAGDFQDLNDIEMPKELWKINRDGYILNTTTSKGRNYILALGKQEKGAVNATWQLIRELDVQNKAIRIGQLNIAKSPFIKIREVMLCDPWKPPMNEILKEKYCPRNWSIEKLQNYVDMFDSFGFNAIQSHDLDFFGQCVSVKGVTLADWRKKLIAMCDRAHGNGQTMNLFIWGGSLYDPSVNKNNFINVRFHNPAQRQKMLAEYDRLADLAPYLDRIHTHWVDPGGCRDCNQCTIKTPQEYYNILIEKFRAKNPNIEGSFSLWWMTGERCSWTGFKDIESSILNSGILPKDTIIAVTPGLWDNQNLKKLKQIHKAGYRGACWNWRVADWELANGLHSHAKTIEAYFRSFSPEVSEELEWHCVGCISQFLVMSNLYVTAQLMWDMQKSGEEALREFNRGMFGRENEDKMTYIMNAVEVGFNCGDCLKGRSYTFEKEQLPKKLKMIEKAKTELKTVRIAEDFVPIFPIVIEPSQFLEEMDAQLDDMISFIQFQIAFSEIMPKISEMKANGASVNEIRKVFDTIPAITKPDRYLTKYGYRLYEGTLNKALE